MPLFTLARSTLQLPVDSSMQLTLQMVARHPEIGPLWRYANPKRPTRYLLVPGFHDYLIFYRHELGEVRLGRLLHGAQDLKDVLLEQ